MQYSRPPHPSDRTWPWPVKVAAILTLGALSWVVVALVWLLVR
jgi:hypothetical protein